MNYQPLLKFRCPKCGQKLDFTITCSNPDCDFKMTQLAFDNEVAKLVSQYPIHPMSGPVFGETEV